MACTNLMQKQSNADCNYRKWSIIISYTNIPHKLAHKRMSHAQVNKVIHYRQPGDDTLHANRIQKLYKKELQYVYMSRILSTQYISRTRHLFVFVHTHVIHTLSHTLPSCQAYLSEALFCTKVGHIIQSYFCISVPQGCSRWWRLCTKLMHQ
jgi:hypothetical protein